MHDSTPDRVETLDTTLREGTQARSVNFTLQARIKIAQELDDIGVHIIEAGWPASSPKEREFFKLLREFSFKNSKIAAFTMTRRRDRKVTNDENLNAVIESDVSMAVIVGKGWNLHVSAILKTTLEDNLNIITESIEYLRSHGIEVIFDAEHFFDGYRENPEYSLKVLKAAEEASARTIVLADTNGGFLPHQVYAIVSRVVKCIKTPIGVHMHNDSGNSVANTILAVLAGAKHIQVTVNGIGERTGNADLCQVIPNLELKLGIRTLKKGKSGLRKLTYLSNLVYELAGIPKNPYQPYVGEYAFAHKAGLHIDAILKCRRAYEHIDPSQVGNERLLTVSDLSGRSAVIAKISEELGIVVDKGKKEIIEALNEIKKLGLEEVALDSATATVSLLLLKHLHKYKEKFKIKEWAVISSGDNLRSGAYGITKVLVGEETRVEAGEGVGPVHAIDIALRKALEKNYPELGNVRLIDYRVVLPEVARDTASMVRVFMKFSDGAKTWTTTATSRNIIEASLRALIEGLDYYLQLKELKKSD